MLADMAIGVETARLATFRAAWEVDQVSDSNPQTFHDDCQCNHRRNHRTNKASMSILAANYGEEIRMVMGHRCHECNLSSSQKKPPKKIRLVLYSDV